MCQTHIDITTCAHWEKSIRVRPLLFVISFNALKVLSASEIYYSPLIMSSWYCGIKKFSLWIAALLLALAIEWREKSRGKEEGERRVSSPSLPVPNAFFFFFFFWVVPTIWTFLALADSSVAVSKNDTKTINVSRFDQAFFFFRKTRKLSFNRSVIASRALSWRLVEIVGVLSARLFTTWQFQLDDH